FATASLHFPLSNFCKSYPSLEFKYTTTLVQLQFSTVQIDSKPDPECCSRSENGQRVIYDESEIIAVPSPFIEINEGITRPEPESTHGSFLYPVVGRNIPLVLIGDPFPCCWIYRVHTASKIEGCAEASDVILKIVREP